MSVESYSIYFFVTGLFHSASRLQALSVLEFPYFLKLDDIHGVDLPHFVCPFVHGWTLGCCPLGLL